MISDLVKENPAIIAGSGVAALGVYANRRAIARAAATKAKKAAWKTMKNPKFLGLAALGVMGDVITDTDIEQKILDKIF